MPPLDGARAVALAEEGKQRAEQRNKPQQREPAWSRSSDDAHVQAWARAALEAEVEAVRSAPEGTRNHQLNASAFSLGQLVGGGHLSEADVERELWAAAEAAGLRGREIQKTLASGMRSGIRDPRRAPAPRLRERSSESERRSMVEAVTETTTEAVRRRKQAQERVVAAMQRGDYSDAHEEIRRLVRASEPIETTGFELVEADQIMAPLPPRNWLVRDLQIGPGAPVGFFAYSFSGKTLVEQSQALSVATGRKVWGRFACRQGRVVHIDYEQGSHETRDRYQRLARAMGVEGGELGGNLAFESFPSVRLTSGEAREAFMRVAEGAAMLLIDSLAGAQSGLDENSTEFAERMHMLSEVSEQQGTTVVLIGHTGKADISDHGHKDTRSAPRGSSQIIGNCSTAYHMTGRKREPKKVEQIKGRGLGMPEVEDFFLKLEQVKIDGYHNPDFPSDPGGFRVRYMCAEEYAELQAEELANVRPELLLAVRALVRQCGPEGASKAQVEREVEGRADAIRLAVKRLAADGSLVIAKVRGHSHPRILSPEHAS